jgi:arabinose-5-phosphate isomerase
MSRKGLGMTTIVDAADRLLGVFTDGDLRRALDRRIDVRTTPMDDVMTREPRTIGPRRARGRGGAADGATPDHRAARGGRGTRVVGALNIHDLLRAGVM